MPFVVSGGQLAAVERRPSPRPAASLQLTDTIRQTYDVLYRTQPAVRTVVSFLARNVAHLGLHLYARTSDTDRTRVTDHPLARLLASPAPLVTRFRLLQHYVSELCIYDAALLVKVKPDGADVPGALVPVPMQLVEPAGDNWLNLDGWTLKGSGDPVRIPREAGVWVQGYNPSNPRWGSSPLEALRQILAEELAASRHREKLWRNGARASGYIERPQGAGWSDGARQRFRTAWQEQYAGDGTQAGGTPILEDGMTYKPASVSPEAAQYIEARKLTREEVAAAFHVPPPMVGILDRATFSNIEEQHRNLYQDCLGPLLEQLQQEFEAQLFPDFPDLEPARFYLEFNLQEKLRGTFEEQASILQTATGAPWLTRNEARARQNLPAVDGGDDLVVPLNVLTGGQASPTDSAPPPDPAKALPPARARVKARAGDNVQTQVAQILTAFFTRQGSSVLSALGAGKTLEEAWDVERWDRELGADLYRAGALIAEAAGKATLDELGLDSEAFTVDALLGWLLANANGVASAVNTTTREALAAAELDDDPGASRAQVFALARTVRAPQIATSQTSAVSGFGTVEAVKGQSAQAAKTWHAGSNPRSAHARLDGETVPLDGVFSNGARWPGDSQLPPDERAGCNCRMTVALQEAQ